MARKDNEINAVWDVIPTSVQEYFLKGGETVRRLRCQELLEKHGDLKGITEYFDSCEKLSHSKMRIGVSEVELSRLDIFRADMFEMV
jgi:hypothetical protein